MSRSQGVTMDEDMLIEETIEMELAKIDICPTDAKELETDFEAEALYETEMVPEELPESVVSCLKVAESRVQHLEEFILQDAEDRVLNDCYAVIPYHSSEYLEELALEYNEDPEIMKRRILVEIEEENKSQSTVTHTGNKTLPPEHGTINAFLTEEKEQDDEDAAITPEYLEVEERCRLELLLWEEKQNKVEENRRSELRVLKELQEKQQKEEEERRVFRQQQFEEERRKLELRHMQQQADLEEKICKEQEALQEELRQQEELIRTLEVKMEEERQVFEEQKENERKRQEERQHKAATVIQAQFRASTVYKKYTSVLKDRREERQRKRELQLKMERDKKEMEEKIQRKLAEQKHKEDEERRRREEIEKLQREEAEMQRIQYEKKKEEEKQRVQKEKQLQLEQLKKEKEEKERQLKKEKEEKERLKRNELERKVREQEENRKDIERKEQEIKRKAHEEATVHQPDRKQKEEVMTLHNENINNLPTISSENVMKSRKENEPNIDQKRNIIGEQNKQQSFNGGSLTLSVESTIKNREAKIHIGQGDQSSKTVDCQFIRSVVSEGMQGDSSETITIDRNDVKEKVNGTLPSIAVKNYESARQTALNSMYEGRSNDSQGTIASTARLPDGQLMLPDHTEKKRLSWMKTCIPWARISSENKRKKVVKKSRPRKSSACQLPPLSADIILQSGDWSSLQQVTTVTLQDLPGFSLSSFSQCVQLKSVTLRRCGLIALDGLSSCKELKYIDVQENAIKTINCLNLENLCVLLLNQNQLTSIHGLDGCTDLQALELSHNKVTRIGNLESLKKLERMVVSHNQLINTKGLSETPTLLYLDCSFNHLTSIDGIECCGLLQILKLQGNNLTEFPKLENHVLLREIYLDDNSISSLKNLSSCWLPLLKVLSLSQNSLTYLPSLSEVMSLEKLDISNNCLSEMKSAFEWFSGCQRLWELTVDGNPLQQDANWRCTILKVLPNLRFLNGKPVDYAEGFPIEKTCRAPQGSFLALCQAQHQDLELLLKRHATELGGAQSALDVAEIQSRHLGELMGLAEEHRYAHEYGDLSINDRDEPETQRSLLKQTASDSHHHNNLFIPGAKENKQNSEDISERWIAPGHIQPMGINGCRNREEENQRKKKSTEEDNVNFFTHHYENNKRGNSQSVLTEENSKTSAAVSASMVGKHLQRVQQNNLENFAATVIQSHWRGYVIRRDISFYSVLHAAATLIQSAWKGYCVRKKTGQLKKLEVAHMDSIKSGRCADVLRHKAATTIQATWKGFLLRKKLASALAAVGKDETEDEFEEVNLDDFIYNEATLEKEWLMLDSTCFPSKTLVISNQLHWPKPPSNFPVTSGGSSSFPWQPQQAWHGDDNRTAVKPSSYSSSTGMQQCSSSEIRTLSRLSEKRYTADSEHSFRTQKEEKLSEEWGFKDMQTAHLMLKRAQKMKSKKARNKKLLDPAVRLALFKSNENKHPPVSPPKKVQPARANYFKAREEEFARMDTTSVEKVERSRELTYQWLHTQVGDYKTTSSRIMKSGRFLPELDPDVLNGGRVQLVSSPISREAMDLDIVSVASGSAVTQASEKNNRTRRHSVELTKKHMPMPVNTNSTPSKMERISFRDNPVQHSTGWGSGKKRGSPFK